MDTENELLFEECSPCDVCETWNCENCSVRVQLEETEQLF